MEHNGNEMISFGAGVNSVAMTIMLVNEGWRGPIVFADTGGEWPETYCYISYFEQEWLKPRGLGVTRLEPGSEWHHKGRDCSLENYCIRWSIIPLLAVRWCSMHWKGVPLDAWGDTHGFTMRLIGFSGEEHKRIKDFSDQRYPLYEAGVSRRECQRIVQSEGLSIPFKSGCFFCPGQSLADWRRLYHTHPNLYERAAQLEDTASEVHGKKTTLDTHDISLRQHAKRRWKGQIQMDLSKWLPCICRL